MSLITEFILWVGKMTIALSCGLIAFAYLDQDQFVTGDKKISSPLLPVLITLLLAYMVARVLLAVAEVAITTVFLCYCVDCEKNDGKPVYAPSTLLDAVGVAAKRRDSHELKQVQVSAEANI